MEGERHDGDLEGDGDIDGDLEGERHDGELEVDGDLDEGIDGNLGKNNCILVYSMDGDLKGCRYRSGFQTSGLPFLHKILSLPDWGCATGWCSAI